jgi:hypothetical protein
MIKKDIRETFPLRLIFFLIHSNTVAEPHHFYAAPVPDPVPGENLDVTWDTV